IFHHTSLITGYTQRRHFFFQLVANLPQAGEIVSLIADVICLLWWWKKFHHHILFCIPFATTYAICHRSFSI
ncbi:MAG: hypothetical protein PHI12_09540, partial [Dehalococcoidales bacterium]|nr:hypothetical protein [Dehalococcoidales bacterium]